MSGPARPHAHRDALLLAIDTATQRAVVAIGDTDGRLLAETVWTAGHRHGEELLPRLSSLLDGEDLRLAEVAAIVVGTGPGAFTGLRVGIATAKALAHGLGRPIIGVSTADALLRAAAHAGDRGGADAETAAAVLLPAGPSDRVLVVDGEARLLPAGTDPPEALEPNLVAVDLQGRAPAAAVARGAAAMDGLGAAMLRIGAERLAAGAMDDLARLVPEYVTLPRGVTTQRGEVAWSRDRR